MSSTEFHPRWYRPRVSTYWWLWKWPYFKFILRELSSVAVAWSVVLTLVWLRALAQGPAALAELRRWLATPPLVALDAVALAFVVFHAVTWFNLAPRAMVVRVRGKRLPDAKIVAANYAAWAAASAAIALAVLWGGR